MSDTPIVVLLPGLDGTGRLYRRLVGSRGLRTVQRVRPSAECLFLDGPHMLLEARPDETADIILGYLRRWFAGPAAATGKW